jgi:hypothetical protein
MVDGVNTLVPMEEEAKQNWESLTMAEKIEFAIDTVDNIITTQKELEEFAEGNSIDPSSLPPLGTLKELAGSQAEESAQEEEQKPGLYEGIEKIMDENPDAYFSAETMHDAWASNSIDLGEPYSVAETNAALHALADSQKIAMNDEGYFAKLTTGPKEEEAHPLHITDLPDDKINELQDSISKGFEAGASLEEVQKDVIENVPGTIQKDDAFYAWIAEQYGEEEETAKPSLNQTEIKAYVLDALKAGYKKPGDIFKEINSLHDVDVDDLAKAIAELFEENKIITEHGQYSLPKELLPDQYKSIVLDYLEHIPAASFDKLFEFVSTEGIAYEAELKVYLEELEKEGKLVLHAGEKGGLPVFTLPKVEPEAPHTESDQLQEVAMSQLIQQGLSQQAIVALFEGGTYKANLNTTASKLWKMYHPDTVGMTQTLNKMPSWILQKLNHIAESMLMKGKTVEDTIWWIAYNFNVTKESVAPMVNSYAQKPIQQESNLIAIATKIIAKDKKLAGCFIDSPLDKLMPSTVAYCQGVTAPIGKIADAIATLSGKGVIHTSEHQKINLITNSVDDKWDSKLGIQLEQEGNVQPKLEGIIEVLTGWKLQCKQDSNHSIYCTYGSQDGMSMSIEQADDLRKTAIFLSSIDNIHLLDPVCIPKAILYAKEHSKGINSTSKPWSVPCYPNSIEEWEKVVCSKM